MKTNLISKWASLWMCILFSNVTLLTFGQSVLSSFATGTGTSASLPIHGLYDHSFAEMIYFQNELNPSIQGVSSKITKLRFYYLSGSIQENKNWKIHLSNTSLSNFASNTAWIPLAGMTLVFNGDISSYITEAGWFEIPLQTPFIYSGTGNIALAIEQNTPGYSSTSFRVHGTTVANRSIQFSKDGTAINTASLPTASQRINQVPQTIFVHEPNQVCSGTPTHSTVSASPATICEGKSTVLTYREPTFSSGFEFTWQKQDGANWIDLATNTSTSYTLLNQNTTGTYRVKVKCTSSLEEDLSDPVTVTVSPKPVLTTNISKMIVCDGESIGLIADGASTYVWSPTTGLNNSNSNFVNATITNNTNYKVIGTSTNGCKDSTNVDVLLLSKVKLPFTLSPAEICEASTPVTITVDPTRFMDLSNQGTWEYQFLDAADVTVQDWSAANTYTFTPTQDSIYNFSYKFRSTNCPTILTLPVAVNIVVGFKTDVSLTHYDCNTLKGTAVLSNYFGQTEEMVSYQNSLSTASADISLTGSATYANNKLTITPSQTSVNGIAVLTTPTPMSNSFEIDFLLTADQIINNFGTGGADGIAYSFANDGSTSGSTKENGTGSKLRLSFDAANNGSNTAGIYLIYGKTSTAAPLPTETTTKAYSSNTSWKNQTDIPVKIIIEDNSLTLKLDNEVIFNQIALPASYANENVTTWKHYFSAATGGDAMRHAISNIAITKRQQVFGISTSETVPPTTWQLGTTFTDLAPGHYSIWMAKSETGCNKNVSNIEIKNENPIINLGADTVICNGTSLVLDTDYPNASYIWNGSTNTTQTHTVNTSGSYMVYVTNNTSGCTGIGIIQVTTLDAPTVTAIDAQTSYENAFFTLTGVANTQSVNWDFGDGHTLTNGPTSVSHVYENKTDYTVTATLTNKCGTTPISTTITIDRVLAIDEVQEIAGLKVYPNPTNGILNISLDNSLATKATLTDMQGKIIINEITFYSNEKLDLKNYDSGVYFLKIENNESSTILKIMVR